MMFIGNKRKISMMADDLYHDSFSTSLITRSDSKGFGIAVQPRQDTPRHVSHNSMKKLRLSISLPSEDGEDVNMDHEREEQMTNQQLMCEPRVARDASLRMRRKSAVTLSTVTTTQVATSRASRPYAHSTASYFSRGQSCPLLGRSRDAESREEG